MSNEEFKREMEVLTSQITGVFQGGGIDHSKRVEVTEAMAERFRRAWKQAHREGDAGNRVKRGLEAALNGR